MKKKLLLLSLMTGPLLVYSADQGKEPASPVQEEIRAVDKILIEKEIAKEKEQVYIKVEKKAEFPGGNKKLSDYIKGNLKYPPQALDEGVEGVVLVKFIIKADGSIEDARVLRGVHPLLDEEALRSVKGMPKWIPAQNHGKDVSSYFTLPIIFRTDSWRSDKK